MKITFSNLILASTLLQTCINNSTLKESNLPINEIETRESFNDSLEKKKYLNFLAAVENSSTFNYFTVITVKNLNTSVVKEICVKGNFLSGAVHTELGIGYNKQGQVTVNDFMKSKKTRYFEFQNIEALENISFFDYDPNEITAINTNTDFDIPKLENDESFDVPFIEGKMKTYAHFLFNKGYLTGENSCFGGRLELVNRPE